MNQEALRIVRSAVKKNNTKEIYLDDLQITKISEDLKKELESLKKTTFLSLNNCELTTLENFPNISGLTRLELMENKISGKDLKCLSNLTTLKSLSLGENKIETYEDLEPLKDIKGLVQLDLFDNVISQKIDYRARIFEMFPTLVILDNLDINGKDNDDEDEDELEEEDSEEESENKEEDSRENNSKRIKNN